MRMKAPPPSRIPGPSVEAARCHGMAEASGPLYSWGVEQGFGEDDQTLPAVAMLAQFRPRTAWENLLMSLPQARLFI